MRALEVNSQLLEPLLTKVLSVSSLVDVRRGLSLSLGAAWSKEDRSICVKDDRFI